MTVADQETFDFIVIGGGPAGYTAAIRAAQHGMKTALVEKRPTLGGTCLNVGCIPSKALLHSSELAYGARHHFKEHGITAGAIFVDWKAMVARKQSVVDQTVKGIDFLMKKNGVTRFVGEGSFLAPGQVQVKGESNAILSAPHILIATGSESAPLPSVGFDGRKVISSTEALALDALPKDLVVIGAGAIGLEMGLVFARLGVPVTVVEFADTAVPAMDRQVGEGLAKSLAKQGMKLHFSHRVTGAKVDDKGVRVDATDANGNAVSFSAALCLLAAGRRPFTAGLGLDNVGIKLDDRGRIPVNEKFATAAAGIYAVGDVIPGPMLAHKASEEASTCVDYLSGQGGRYNPLAIPAVVYTTPEAAGVGRTTEELAKAGIAPKVGVFPYKASGRARAGDDVDGFVKVLAHPTTDEILGVHILGGRAADLIAEAVLALEFHATAEDVALVCHAHPTYAEAFKEAAMLAHEGKAVHV